MEYLLYSLINEIREEMPELAYIDEDYGQLEMIDSETDTYPVTFPCALIDAPSVDWGCIEGNHQKGTATIRVRLCIDCYDDTHSKSGTLDKINERQALADKLHNLVQCFRPDDGAPMIRTSSSFSTMNHGIKVYENNYTVTITSYTNNSTRLKVKPVLDKVEWLKEEHHDLFEEEYTETYD